MPNLPDDILIEEYNTLVDYFECCHIDYWDYACPSMDLEIFIDEAFEAISAYRKAEALRFNTSGQNPIKVVFSGMDMNCSRKNTVTFTPQIVTL